MTMIRPFALLGCLVLGGCGLFEWPGAFVPRGDNDENLRHMVANPADLRIGEAARTERGAAASLPIDYLLLDKRKKLLDIDMKIGSTVSSGSGAPQ